MLRFGANLSDGFRWDCLFLIMSSVLSAGARPSKYLPSVHETGAQVVSYGWVNKISSVSL